MSADRVVESFAPVASLKPGLPQLRAPGLLSVLAEEIGLAPVGLIELVRDLEHGEHQAALRPGPGLVPAAGGAPDEFAGLAHAFAADQAALEHVGLLDPHMLVVRPPRAAAPRGRARHTSPSAERLRGTARSDSASRSAR